MQHHVDEDEESLASKRLLASYHQLSVSPHGEDHWHVHERDRFGDADVDYAKGRGIFGRVTYQKHQEWGPDAGRPSIFKQDANVSMIVDEASGVVRRIDSAMMVAPRETPPDPSGHSSHVRENKGFDVLPKKPTTVHWTLLRVEWIPESAARRGLTGAGGSAAEPAVDEEHPTPTEAFFVTGTLHHELSEALLRRKSTLAGEPGENKGPLCAEARKEAIRLGRCAVADAEGSQEERAQIYNATAECVIQLKHLEEKCLSKKTVVPVIEAMLLSKHCERPNSCSNLLNALHLIDSNASRAAIARFVRDSAQVHLPRGFVNYMKSDHPPSPQLLLALYGRLLDANAPPASAETVRAAQALVEPDGLRVPSTMPHHETHEDAYVDGPHAGHAGHDPLLLGAGTAVLMATLSSNSSVLHGLSQLIVESIGSLLRKALDQDREYDRIYDTTHAHTDDVWEGMHMEAQLEFMRHHSHFNRRAMKWELENGNRPHHEQHARRQMMHTHLTKHERYHKREDSQSVRRIRVALRALHNARDLSHVPLISTCAQHRSDDVIHDALTTLGELQDVTSEAAIVRSAREQLEVLLATPTSTLRTMGNSAELVRKALDALDNWQTLDHATIDELARMMLQLPMHLPDEPGGDAVPSCTDSCKTGCNPHQHVAHCNGNCITKCEHGTSRGLRGLQPKPLILPIVPLRARVLTKRCACHFSRRPQRSPSS